MTYITHPIPFWDAFLSSVVPHLDELVQALVPLVAVAVPSQRGHGAGVFFFPHQEPWWDAWSEPGAFTIRLGRVEIQIDRARPE